MAFEHIPPIPTSKQLLDVGFGGAAKLKGSSKDILLERMKIVKITLDKHLRTIITSFPSIDDLTPLYLALFKALLPYAEVKKALGTVQWARKRIAVLTQQYREKMFGIEQKGRLHEQKKAYYGRISSTLKQLDQPLKLLAEARKQFRNFPTVKSGIPTYCIVGFPNVGKTTLLSKLSGSTAAIKSYAFTTKGINVGFTKGKKAQLLDTPGTLNRKEKMNTIELVAYIAMQHADQLIYVFDPTETYSFAQQKKLYQRIKKLRKPLHVYISKQDVVDVPKELENYDALSFEALTQLLA